MKKNLALYYLLILVLVMGAFAAMALNSYGVPLMSYVALAFGLLFLYELIGVSDQKTLHPLYKIVHSVELISLALLSLLYFLRGINFEIPFTLVASVLLLMLLLCVNVYYFLITWRQVKATPVKLKVGLLFYFASLLLLLMGNFLPNTFTNFITVMAVVCLVAFFVFGWWKGRVIVNGEEVSAWHKVLRFKNKTGIQLILLTLFAVYSLLSSYNVLPPLYVGSLPNGYAKVVRQWEVNKVDSNSKQVNPLEFEQAYKKFLKDK